MKSLVTPALLFLIIGCARHEYDIVEPPEFAGHVGTKADTITVLDPLAYRWRTVDNRLVVRIANLSSEPIQLLGDASTVVAPSGRSHPLPSQTIAPNSFARLILPPRPPRAGNSRTTFGVGVGVRVDRREFGFPDHPLDDDDDALVEPRYLFVQSGEALFWDWEGETDVRLTFVYQRGEQSFRHEFLVRRKRV
ncbi:MAG: hypothetical protein WBD40_14680 [Tepidisphaeraceae bacterium]